MCNIFKVIDSCIIEILTWEDCFADIRRMGIGCGMRVRVPSSKAEIKTTHESNMSINKTEFLMVSPIENYIVVDSIQSFECVGWDLSKFQGFE